jgi:Glycosyl transferase family 2
MKLIGLMPVRNEAWCLGLTLRAALIWCDEVLVRIHGSTDQTEEIVYQITQEHRGRVRVYVSDDPEWAEMQHRQHMLEEARLQGATHIAIVDADEILTGNLLNYCGLGERFYPNVPAGHCLQLPMYQLRESLDRYHANGIWGNRWLSVAFADDPRLSWSGDAFHSREPGGMLLKPYRPIQHGQGGSFHLWGVSERRLRAKHALYKVTERLRWPDRDVREIELTYNDWRSPEDNAAHWPEMKRYREPWTFADVPAGWWKPYYGLMQGNLYIDAQPWQEAEVRALWWKHGAETFKGLDLFGVA